MIGKKISFYLFRFFYAFFKIVPFWVLYRISDFVYFLLYYVVSYRKTVVLKNLKRCFPDKDEKELKKIMKKFYSNLGDLFLETVKGFSMSKKQLLERFTDNEDNNLANKYFEHGKDVLVLAGHFANWEWAVATIVEKFKHRVVALYKPISNQYIDNYIQENRARFGIELVSIYDTRNLFRKKKDKPMMYILIADQYPPITRKQKIATFFSSKTPFLNGPELYSKLFNIPVLYVEILHKKRGHYSMQLIDLTDKPKDLQENELTQMYATMLENSIIKQPENWVWSHKRWKHELYSA